MRVAVIGGGHQGLVAAVVLARAGLEVTVLEAGDEAGGCLWTQAVGGVAIERGAVDHGGLAAMADELGLADHGLGYVSRDRLASFVFGDGEVRHVEVSAEATAAGLGADADAYRALTARARSLFGMLDDFGTPPTPTALAATLRHLRGGDETFRMLLQSAEVVLGRRLTDPHLRAALALYAAHGQVPPWAPGSGMFALLLPGSHGSPAVRPAGGAASVVAALTSALTAAGGVLRTGARVAGLRSAGGRWHVRVGDEELVADRVVSTVDVRRTVRLLAEPPDGLVEAARSVGSGRLNVAELTVGLVLGDAALPEPLRERHGPVTFVQRGLTDLHRGFGDLVAGRLPTQPWAMVARADVDGQVDGRPAAPSRPAVWLSSVVPLERADGPWTPRRERAAAERVVGAVGTVLGFDLAAAATDVVVAGPGTWGDRLQGDGNPNHLDLTVDQLLGWRPPALPGHRTPAPGLYLAGAGTHPGGGLSGASGRAAASAVIADLAGRPRRRMGSGAAREVTGLWRALGAYRQMRREASA